MPDDAVTRGRGRPAASSRDQIEADAMRLFSEHGYSATTIPMIAQASGVSRATVFRYWGSKSEIVWAEFDRHIQRLGGLLGAESTTDEPTLTIVRRVVVRNLGQSIEDSRVWLARFALVDESEELRAEEALHWSDWAAAIARFVAERHGLEPAHFVAQSVAGAVQGAFLGVLRSRPGGSGDDAASVMLPVLDAALASVGGPLQVWLDQGPGTGNV
jgi:AcrR family transcriptional regulator